MDDEARAARKLAFVWPSEEEQKGFDTPQLCCGKRRRRGRGALPCGINTPLSREDMEFIQKTENDNKAVSKIIKGWGSDVLISRGKPYKAQDLDGVLAHENGKIIGLGLYYIKNNECEIVLLETFDKNKGIGTKIIEKLTGIAKENKCNRIWLVTTNSNIDAIKFYQKRGFDISNIYINAMEEARKIKPEIPEMADNGIKIKDEIEFEIKI